MFSLLITIISLVLVGLLAAATIYYVNNSSDNRWNAIANQPISQAKQIHGALVLQKQDLGVNGELTSLIPNYLSSMPTPSQAAYANDVGEASAADWTVLTGDIKGVALPEKFSEEACKAVNRIMNKMEEIKPLPTSEFIVCYGEAVPYTFLLNFKASPSAVIDAGLSPLPVGEEQLEDLLETIGGDPFEKIDNSTPAKDVFNAPAVTSVPGFTSTLMGVPQEVSQTALGANFSSAQVDGNSTSVNATVLSTTNVRYQLGAGSLSEGSYEIQFAGGASAPLAKSELDVLPPTTVTSVSKTTIDFAIEATPSFSLEIQGLNLNPYLLTERRVLESSRVKGVKAFLIEESSGVARSVAIKNNTGTSAVLELKPFPSGEYRIRWDWPNGESFVVGPALTLVSSDIWSENSAPILEMNYIYNEGPGVATQVSNCGSCDLYAQELSGGTWVSMSDVVGTAVNPGTGYTRRYYRVFDPRPNLGPRTVRVQLKQFSSSTTVYYEGNFEFTAQVNPNPVPQTFSSLPSGLTGVSSFESFNFNESRTTAMFHNVGVTTGDLTLNGTFISDRTGPNSWGPLRRIVDKNYSGIMLASYFAGDTPIDIRFNPPGHPLADDGSTSTNVFCAIQLNTGPDAINKNQFLVATAEGRVNCFDTGAVTPSSSNTVSQTNGKLYVMQPSTKYTFSVDGQGNIADYARIPTNVNIVSLLANTNSRGFVTRTASNGVVYNGPVMYYYGELGIYNLPPVTSGSNVMNYYNGVGIKHPLDLLNLDASLNFRFVHALGAERLLAVGSFGVSADFPPEPLLVDIRAKTMQFLPGYRMNPSAPNYIGTSSVKSLDQTQTGEVYVLNSAGFFGYNAQGTPNRLPPEVVTNPIPAALAATPSTADFGSLAIGESGTLKVQLRNTGSVQYVHSSTSASDPSIGVSDDCELVAAGGTCTLTLTTQKNEAGPISGSVTLTSVTGSSTTVSVTGSVVAPNINANPSSITFEGVEVGEKSRQTLELENVGQVNWDIELEKLNGVTGVSATHSCDKTLEPGETCLVEVSYTPANTTALNEVIRAAKTVGPTTVALSSSNVVEADSTPNVLAVSASYQSNILRSLSLKPDGSLYYVGASIADKSIANDWTLIDTGVAQYSASMSALVYVKQNGDAMGLGDLPLPGGYVKHSTPVLLTTGARAAWSGLSKIFVHKANGVLEAVGANTNGSMGAGPLANRSFSTGFVPVFTTQNEIINLYPGQLATAMHLSDGSVWVAGGDAAESTGSNLYPAKVLLGRPSNANLRLFSQVASNAIDVHFGGVNLFVVDSAGTLYGTGSTARGVLGTTPVSTQSTPSNYEQGFVAMASGVSQISGHQGVGLMTVENGQLRCTGSSYFCGQSDSIPYVAFQERLSVAGVPGLSALLDSELAGPAIAKTDIGLIYQLGGPARVANGVNLSTSVFKQLESLP